jgi:hypothetical protein
MGSDLVYSILSPEWNADKTRVDKVRYWTAVARLFTEIDLCRSESMEAGSGRQDSSHNILTLDALQVLSGSQVTPGLSMSMRIRPIVYTPYIREVSVGYVDMAADTCVDAHLHPSLVMNHGKWK